MRVVIFVAALAALAGCGREPSFDERYGDTANQIQNRGSAIDRDLDRPNNAAEQKAANGSDGA